MKTFPLIIAGIILCQVAASQTLTGLWIGTVNNDSTTIRKDQSFEIVLTQYKDKVYGFSRSTFIVNDSLFYIVKRVKGTIEGNICEVKDDEIVSYNFKGRIDKGVKMISTFRFNPGDSAWHLDGTWRTNQTKKFYSVTGKMNLKNEQDPEQSKIIPHLEELKLAEEMAFYQEYKSRPEPVVAIRQRDEGQTVARPTTQYSEIAQQKPLAAATPVQSKPVSSIEQTAKKNTEEAIRKQELAAAEERQRQEAAIAAKQKEDEIKRQEMAAAEERKRQEVAIAAKQKEDEIKRQELAAAQERQRQEAIKKQEEAAIAARKKAQRESDRANINQKPVAPVTQTVAVANPSPNQKQGGVVETKTILTAPQATPVNVESKSSNTTGTAEIKKEAVVAKPLNNNLPAPTTANAAINVAERKQATAQVVYYKSDSLQLALYDNGEIDGDTVSVLLNGQVILAKQGLKASAIKKTIYVTPGDEDSLNLVLYAENLGKYPPNTGLLVVHDGEEVYQVRFSADLKQNAAVIFRRKRN